MQEKEKRKIERKNFVHSAKVGSIFYTSWGYEQTNVEFYQVVKLVGKSTVIIKQISSHQVEGTEGFDSCEVMPNIDCFLEPQNEIRKKVNFGNYIKFKGFNDAYLWNGKPKYKSWYY